MSACLVQCPNCGTVIDVPVEAVVEDDNVVFKPDLSGVWLHSWSCDGIDPTAVIEVQHDIDAVVAWDGSNPMRRARRWWRRSGKAAS